MSLIRSFALLAASVVPLFAQTERRIPVAKDVTLQVLDWGGRGKPLVLLTGLGSDAHVFDHLAQKLEPQLHVYAITRRGFGASSKPAPTAENYSAARLGEDVLAVIAALNLARPVLAGHSIAGEELSYIGSRHPDKVAGLIYLDASDAYGLYDPSQGDWQLDMIALRKAIDQVEQTGIADNQTLAAMAADTARLQSDLASLRKQRDSLPGAAPPPLPPIPLAIRFGEQEFTTVSGPVLALIACPHNFDHAPGDQALHRQLAEEDRVRCSETARHFAVAIPQARIQILPNADHFLFVSDETAVVSAVKAFVAFLP